MSGPNSTLLSIFLALGANFLIAVSKFIAAFVTGSGAMLAEAVHSSADCGNQLLLLIGIKRSRKPADEEHPLGHGMSIYFWSFIVAIILFTLGGLFSLYEGIEKFRTPHEVESPVIAIAVLVISIILEAISLIGCIKQVNKNRGGQSLLRWFHNSTQSELIVVFGEDIAALLGLSVALTAVVLTVVTGNTFFDAAGTVTIGIILITIAICVGYEVVNLLIGQSTDAPTRDAILQFLSKQDKISRIFNIITLQLGPDIMVSVKARMRESASVSVLISDINQCEESLKKEFPSIRWLFFEPDENE